MDYDLIIIGAGWAGFNAALKARGLGLKVALVEKDALGGTCLNYGCIPTKSLVQSARTYALVKKSAVFGITAGDVSPDFSRIQARKDKLVGQLQSGMKSLLGGIDLLEDEARLLSRDTLKVGQRKLKTRFILVSSGSRPLELPHLKIDGKRVISSNDILSLKEPPASLLIIGGGVIGCEFASLFSMLGVRVGIAEKMTQLLPGMDRDIARRIEGIFRKRGINVMLQSDTNRLQAGIDSYEKSLLCVGRKANSSGMGMEELGIAVENGRIVTDGNLKTAVDNIYAAGDCTSTIMLAHLAAYQGELAVENMLSSVPRKSNTANIPSCIFTSPEIAATGLTEEDANNLSIPSRVYRFDFRGSGMAHILDETDGFIKIVSDDKSGRIMGGAIIGPRATELIGTLGLAVSCSLTVAEVRETVFAHPTISESLRDALKSARGL
ncbi:MAG: dihydrolipoyl dehydrogenase [Candidatus Omnitrophota bacterium]|jgi:dihydrolipoamide dehydrogenase